MRIFKFGGASVKNAEGVKNLVKVLKKEGSSNTLIVISAMGKMTNAFEKIIDSYYKNTKELVTNIETVRAFHTNLVNDLFENSTEILFEIEILFGKLSGFLTSNNSNDYNYIYDQIIGFGELLSTKIVSHYLNEIAITNNWIDVREYIITDNNYRAAKVDWDTTTTNIQKLNTTNLYITQGFLGSCSTKKTTSLGREGSDFSAAIFAHCLNAKSLTIWKDVDGVLNADPRYFNETQLLEQISYSEAIEMAFYGASVIHPKTLKPLENKNIPLFVRSFLNLDKEGTVVGKGSKLIPETPCFILKQNQILVSISALDFSFMVEHNLSTIFKMLHNSKLKVNLIQNSALSFSVCIEDNFNNFDSFLKEIKPNFNIQYKKNTALFTIRHATKNAISNIEKKGAILLKQATKNTVQIVIEQSH
ncbi:aspartate kinase [Lutibacter oricola]|uniref:Aspartokinase n=1 Tax=Lutibacter oricola TaxID=762486 RepID=A0A1H2RRZ2_9FLAO|nr:aspartate kinase [Lutibacter oricola]SDW21544.1 aspartate kinase [Lutibacter oricola]